MPLPTRSSQDGWNEYRRLVLAELQRLNDCVEKLRTDQEDMRKDINISYGKVYRAIANNDKGADRELHELEERIASTLNKDMQALNSKIEEIKVSFTKAIDDINNTLNTSGVEDLGKNKVAFWTAVITAVVAILGVIGSMLT